MAGAAPAALLDVDGVLVEGSLGIAFTAHRFADEYPYKDGIAEAVARFRREDAYRYEAMAADIVEYWRDGLQGRAAETIREDAAAFAAEYPVTEAGEAVVTRLDAAGFDIYFVSINPQEVLEPFAERQVSVEVAGVYGTALSVDEDGVYDGGFARDLITGERSKADVVPDIFAQSQWTGSIAVGDTETDRPLFEQVATGVLIMAEGEELERLRDRGEVWDYRFPTVAALQRALPRVVS